MCVEPNMFPQYGRYFSVYNTNEGDTIVSYREYNYDYLSQAWYRNIIKSNNAEWVDPFHGFSEVSVDENEAGTSTCGAMIS